MIEIVDASKHFDGKKAVDHLTLTVHPGELYAFLGPNGAGKTTTIKMIAGLLRPTSGRIAICGIDVNSESLKAKRLLSYVPDQPYLYEKLSGREFLEFVGRMYGMDSKTVEERIEHYGELFDYLDYMNELSESYSHGMKQRIVLASAFIHDPRAIVIDEPMVGLDPRSARILKDHLLERVAGGATVFISTHTLAVAEELASRIGIIHKGQLIAEGSPEELRSRGQSHRSLEEVFLTLTMEESCG